MLKDLLMAFGQPVNPVIHSGRRATPKKKQLSHGTGGQNNLPRIGMMISSRWRIVCFQMIEERSN
jgi:hypothetical protein